MVAAAESALVNVTENVNGDAAAVETGSAGIEAARMIANNVASGAEIGLTGSDLTGSDLIGSDLIGNDLIGNDLNENVLNESVLIENDPIENDLIESGQRGQSGTVQSEIEVTGIATAGTVVTVPMTVLVATCLGSARSVAGAEAGSENASGAGAAAVSIDVDGSAMAPTGALMASSRNRLAAAAISNSSSRTALQKIAGRLADQEATMSRPMPRATTAGPTEGVATTARASHHSRWKGPKSTTRLQPASDTDRFCLVLGCIAKVSIRDRLLEWSVCVACPLALSQDFLFFISMNSVPVLDRHHLNSYHPSLQARFCIIFLFAILLPAARVHLTRAVCTCTFSH